MKLPIIVVDAHGVDLSIHESVGDAERRLEAIDVRNGEYVGYDAEGRLLAFDTATEKKRVLMGLIPTEVETVRITEAESDPTHADDLRRALIAFLDAVESAPTDVDAMPIGALVENARTAAQR